MAFLRYLLGLLAATAVYTIGQKIHPEAGLVLDPFLILVVYHGLATRPGWDSLGGATAGLVHDALTGGAFGVFGFADTVVAYTAGRLRGQLVLQRAWRIAVFFGLMALAQRTLVTLLLFLFATDAEIAPPWSALVIAIATAVLGAWVFAFARRLRARTTSWRTRRARKLTIERNL